MKKRDALKPYVNSSADSSALSSALQADLNLVADAYASTEASLIELEKAFSRIDSIAAQEGTGAAVKAFREIAAAQKDIASTMIALRHEARATIQARLAAQADPPVPAGAGGFDGIAPAAKISPSHASNPDNSDSPVIASDSAPAANIPENPE